MSNDRARASYELPALAALIGAAVLAGSLVVSSTITIGGSSGPSFSTGSNAPSGSAAKGSLYISTNTANLYQNADGAGTWNTIPSLGVTDAWYGTGALGVCNYDGTTVVDGVTPSTVTAPSNSREFVLTGYKRYQLSRSPMCTDVIVSTNVQVSMSGSDTGGVHATGTLTINGTGLIMPNVSAGGDASAGIGGAGGVGSTSNFYAGRAGGGAGGAQAGAGGAANGGSSLPFGINTCSANAPGTAACVAQGGAGGKNEVGTGTTGNATSSASIVSGNWGYGTFLNLLTWHQGFNGSGGSAFGLFVSGAGGRGSNAAGNGGGGGGGTSGYVGMYVFAKRIVDNGTGGGSDPGLNSTGVVCAHGICNRGANGGDAQQTGCSGTCAGGGGGGGAGGYTMVVTSGACPLADVRGGYGGLKAPAANTSNGGNGGDGVYNCFHASAY